MKENEENKQKNRIKKHIITEYNKAMLSIFKNLNTKKPPPKKWFLLSRPGTDSNRRPPP